MRNSPLQYRSSYSGQQPILNKILNNKLAAGASRLKLPWAGFAAALLALALSLTPWWHEVELKAFDWLTISTAPNRSELPITIVGIDEASFAALKQQWPWPRSLHAQILDRLREAEASVVAFDVVFSELSPSPKDDAALAQAIKNFGPVVLAADLTYAETEGSKQWLRVEPHELFQKAGATPGFASVQIDPDGVQRQVPVAQDAFWRQILTRFDQRNPGVVGDLSADTGMRIRYLGGPHTFTYIPFYKLLEPEKNLGPNWKEFLKDNIVLIGRDLNATTEVNAAQADMFQTPFFAKNKMLMPGVEIHANLIANMVSGEVIHEAPPEWSRYLLAGVALLTLLLMRRWQPVKSGIVGLLLIAAVGGADYALFAKQLLWLPAAATVLAIVLIYLAQGGVAYFIESRQRRQIKQAFSMYVSPAVVEEMTAHPERLTLGGERRELTLLFTDLAGFTSISEALNAEEVAAILNRHLTEMTASVLEYNGTVDKFIGDAVMAFWGAPILDVDQSEHALRAAIQMQQKIAAMRAEVSAAGGPDLHMRIGVHRGDCIVGNMGGDNRFDYTAIGDTVNLASRMEGVNKVYHTGILVSDSVAQAVAGKIPLRPVDTVRVKGKHLGVDLYTPCDNPALIEASTNALAAYRQGDWAAAEAKWQAVAEQFPEDPLPPVFLERLAEFRSHGYPADWDGITTLESK
jgi:adenylate cyclase